MAALECVDFVYVFSDETPNVSTIYYPDILVRGGDCAMWKIVGYEHVLRHGGEVKSLQFIEGRSATQIIEKANKEERYESFCLVVWIVACLVSTSVWALQFPSSMSSDQVSQLSKLIGTNTASKVIGSPMQSEVMMD